MASVLLSPVGNGQQFFDNNGVPDSNTVIQLNYGIADADSFIAGPAVTGNVLVSPIANASMNVSIFEVHTNRQYYQ